MLDARLPGQPEVDRTPSRPDGLACTWTTGGPGVARMQVTGELDYSTVPQLELGLREPELPVPRVELDLSGLVFVDVAGVFAIVNAGARARQQGGRLVLLRCPASIEHVFALAGAVDQIEMSDVPDIAPPRAERPERSARLGTE